MKLLITFHTTTAAMTMEAACRRCGAPGRLVPVPGSISADCGLAWCADPQQEESLLKILQEAGIDYQVLHRCLL